MCASLSLGMNGMCEQGHLLDCLIYGICYGWVAVVERATTNLTIKRLRFLASQIAIHADRTLVGLNLFIFGIAQPTILECLQHWPTKDEPESASQCVGRRLVYCQLSLVEDP